MSALEWNKLGLVLAPPLALSFSHSHAAVPTVDLEEGMLYFATRDADGRSWIARAELDLSGEQLRVVRLDPDAVVKPGELGAFDDSGVTVSCLVTVNGEKRLYYTGWSLGVTVPFYLGIGLAISRDGGPFERVSAAPVIGRTSKDPYLTASPHVLGEDGGFRMWYISCERWTRMPDGSPRHHYHVRCGESEDGVQWQTQPRACIDFASASEYAFSRPCVIRGETGYEMWYSVRGDSYRLGYARSADGLEWERFDALAGLDRADHGWDSEMIAYPHVFDHGGMRYVLYNGNGYGASGIGCAVRSLL